MQPLPYDASKWTWSSEDGTHEHAVAHALNAFRRGIGEKGVTKDDWETFSLRTKLRHQAMARHVPAYHPLERTNQTQTAACHEYEIKIATELLDARHSLVVVEPTSNGIEFFTNVAPAPLEQVPSAPAVRTR